MTHLFSYKNSKSILINNNKKAHVLPHGGNRGDHPRINAFVLL